MKKFFKIVFLTLIFIIFATLLVVGPLYKVKVLDVALGEKLLKAIRLDSKNTLEIRMICSWVSGLSFGIFITKIFSKNKDKTDKSKKSNKEVNQEVKTDSLKKPIPSPITPPKEQNNKHISF